MKEVILQKLFLNIKLILFFMLIVNLQYLINKNLH